MGLNVAPMTKLAAAEQNGVRAAEGLGAKSLAELRAKPAAEVLGGRGGGPVIDGWFLPDDPANIYAQGKQNDVPLLLGSNKDEGTFFNVPPRRLRSPTPTRCGSAIWRMRSSRFIQPDRTRKRPFLSARFPRPARFRDAQLGRLANQDRQVQSVSVLLHA